MAFLCVKWWEVLREMKDNVLAVYSLPLLLHKRWKEIQKIVFLVILVKKLVQQMFNILPAWRCFKPSRWWERIWVVKYEFVFYMYLCCPGAYTMGSTIRDTCFRSPILSMTRYVTLGRFLHLFKLQFFSYNTCIIIVLPP